MPAGFSIQFAALEGLESYFRAAPEIAKKSAAIALNDVLGDRGVGMKMLRKSVQDELNFPAGYVDEDKIYVYRYASPDDLEIHVQARQRPTSLARFATSRTVPTTKEARAKGVAVEVHKGKRKVIRSGFLIRLKSGASLTADNFNLGLALRLKPGDNVKNKKEYVKGEKGLYLLYGPSVDQALAETSVETDEPIFRAIETEFIRQFGFRTEQALK